MKRKMPSIVTLAIMTTATIIVWVSYSVYKVLSVKPEPNVPLAILEPIDPSINNEILAQIKERVYFEKGDVGDFSRESSDLEGEFQEEPEEESSQIPSESVIEDLLIESLSETPGSATDGAETGEVSR